MVFKKCNKDKNTRREHDMKIWLIYSNENFVAYADNKEIVSHFIKSRKEDYDVLKVKYRKLPDMVKSSQSFYSRQLVYFVGYNTNMKIPLIQYELELLEFEIRNMCIYTTASIKRIIELMRYIKIPYEEMDSIKEALSVLSNLITDACDFEHEIIYDDIIEIDEFITYFINN